MSSVELGLGIGFVGADSDPVTGETWLLDAGRLGTVIRMNDLGDFEVRFAIQSHSTSDAIAPAGLAFHDGSLFILSRKSEKILRFSTDGTPEGSISLPWADGLDLLGLEYHGALDRFFILTPGRLFESDLSGNLTNTSNITLAREFADLSLDENLGRIYLYTADAGEPWAVALGGQFLFRGTTPVFAANCVMIGAGALDPDDRTRHFVTAEGEADINHLLVPNPQMLAAKHWAAYR